jgi:hypothetical protein
MPNFDAIALGSGIASYDLCASSTIARTGNLDAKNFRILVRRTTTYSNFHVLNIQDTASAFPVHAIIERFDDQSLVLRHCLYACFRYCGKRHQGVLILLKALFASARRT